MSGDQQNFTGLISQRAEDASDVVSWHSCITVCQDNAAVLDLFLSKPVRNDWFLQPLESAVD